MEILVVALAALATLLVPLTLLMAEVAVLGVSSLVEFSAFLREIRATGSWTAARKARQSKRQISPVFSWWTRRLTIGLGLLLVVTLMGVLALNSLFFDWFVRQSLRAAERQNGIAVSFAAADGNLFIGKVHLHDAKFVRTGHTVSDFNLAVDDVRVDADVSQLLTGRIVFQEVNVDGVRGEFTKTGKRDPTLPRRQFTIERLTVDNLAIEVTDKSRTPHEVAVPLAITSLQVADFRSWWAAFDVLFRSTCTGLLDGEPFEISSREVGDARETIWAARDLPIHVLSGYFTGPLGWLVDGRVDVDVTTRWRPEDSQPELEMHCQLVARGFAAAVPPELAALERVVVEPAISALNRSQANLPLEFDLVMKKEAFKGQLSPLAAGLAEAISVASRQTLKQLLPDAAE